MKSALLILIAFVASICTLTSIESADKSSARILVLGFRSDYINDVQDRILRETILKEFIKRGYSIVPVMEIEKLLQEDEENIRKISRGGLRDLCGRLKADFAVSGGINKKTGRYVVDLTVYNSLLDKYQDIRIYMEKTLSFQEYCAPLSVEIVDKIERSSEIFPFPGVK